MFSEWINDQSILSSFYNKVIFINLFKNKKITFQTTLVAIIQMLIANCPGRYNPHTLRRSHGPLSVSPT